MDVERTLSIGIVALDVPRDVGGDTLVRLLESHGARELGITAEDSDCGESVVCWFPLAIASLSEKNEDS